jgi:toxin ParE1/3/4
MPLKPDRYALSPRARNDLEEIWLYTFETWSLAQADSYHADIITACEAAADNPTRGQNVEYLRPGYFRVAVGSHYIFYRETLKNMIEVVRILHQRRDFSRHL